MRSQAIGERADRLPAGTAVKTPRIHGVWQLAWPSITGFALQSMVGLVDLVFVSKLGAVPVAGVGVAVQLHFAVIATLAGVTTGTVALVARAIGGQDHAEAGRVLRASLVLAAGLGCALMALAPATERVVSLVGVESGVVALGGSVLRILLWGSIPLAVGLTFANALRGAGDVRTPLFVGVAMNVVNVVGDYAWIFGNLGAPALGADGSAVATGVSFAFGSVVYTVLWLRNHLKLPVARLLLGVDSALCRRITRIGIPTALEQLAFHMGLFLFLGVISNYGTDAVSAYIIGTRVINFSLIPGFGFQVAAATLVGQHLGAGHPENAERSGWRATAGAIGSMSALGLMIATFARPIASWFDATGGAVTDLAVTFLYIVCAAQPLMAFEFGVGGSLRGAGDTRFPLFALLAGLFVCRLGVALVLLHVFGAPITLVWACLLLDYGLKAGLLATRFQLGRWKKLAI